MDSNTARSEIAMTIAIAQYLNSPANSHSLKLNNDVMKVCYDNFRRSDECVRLQCEFDLAVDVFSGDIKDIVFKRFYNIAVNVF